ncbi:hypothetical protein CRG98_027421 [Punica granatum]|uniref:Uncharacterized protein n=1 Tax=Punica granatum TaxID=22663 RepID=A0A2I0J7H4_PUNGR|nr:hypothetical protein CRG98_027421 [Punica granatum]
MSNGAVDPFWVRSAKWAHPISLLHWSPGGKRDLFDSPNGVERCHVCNSGPTRPATAVCFFPKIRRANRLSNSERLLHIFLKQHVVDRLFESFVVKLSGIKIFLNEVPTVAASRARPVGEISVREEMLLMKFVNFKMHDGFHHKKLSGGFLSYRYIFLIGSLSLMPNIKTSKESFMLILRKVAVRTRISSRRGTYARAYATRLGVSIFPGRATDAREKEPPLPVYDPKVEGR